MRIEIRGGEKYGRGEKEVGRSVLELASTDLYGDEKSADGQPVDGIFEGRTFGDAIPPPARSIEGELSRVRPGCTRSIIESGLVSRSLILSRKLEHQATAYFGAHRGDRGD